MHKMKSSEPTSFWLNLTFERGCHLGPLKLNLEVQKAALKSANQASVVLNIAYGGTKGVVKILKKLRIHTENIWWLIHNTHPTVNNSIISGCIGIRDF